MEECGKTRRKMLKRTMSLVPRNVCDELESRSPSTICHSTFARYIGQVVVPMYGWNRENRGEVGEVHAMYCGSGEYLGCTKEIHRDRHGGFRLLKGSANRNAQHVRNVVGREKETNGKMSHVDRRNIAVQKEDDIGNVVVFIVKAGEVAEMQAIERVMVRMRSPIDNTMDKAPRLMRRSKRKARRRKRPWMPETRKSNEIDYKDKKGGWWRRREV